MKKWKEMNTIKNEEWQKVDKQIWSNIKETIIFQVPLRPHDPTTALWQSSIQQKKHIEKLKKMKNDKK